MDHLELATRWRDIEAHFAGAPTGSQDVDQVIRARLADVRSREPSIDHDTTIPDPWEMNLFIAVCQRYGLRVYRKPRRPKTTVVVVVPASVYQALLWPLFEALADAQADALRWLTTRAMDDAIHTERLHIDDQGTVTLTDRDGHVVGTGRIKLESS
jgi:hypothetical protein